MTPRERAMAKEIGDRLRAERKRHDWSQTGAWEASQHAPLIGTPLKQVVLGSYERGDRCPSNVRTWDLSLLYNVPVASLYPATDPALAAEETAVREWETELAEQNTRHQVARMLVAMGQSPPRSARSAA